MYGSVTSQFSGISDAVFQDHGSWLDVEPWSGKVFQGRKRLQVNFGLSKDNFPALPGVWKAANPSYLYFPIAWVEELGQINSADASSFYSNVLVFSICWSMF